MGDLERQLKDSLSLSDKAFRAGVRQERERIDVIIGIFLAVVEEEGSEESYNYLISLSEKIHEGKE